MAKSLLALAAAAAVVLGGACDAPPVRDPQTVANAEAYAKRMEMNKAAKAAKEAKAPEAEMDRLGEVMEKLRDEFNAGAKVYNYHKMAFKLRHEMSKVMFEGDVKGLKDLKQSAEELGWTAGTTLLDNLIKTGTKFYESYSALPE